MNGLSIPLTVSLSNGHPEVLEEPAPSLPRGERHLGSSPRITEAEGGLPPGNTVARMSFEVRPGYRLRVGEVRVYYDVRANTVDVLAIVAKSQAAARLD